MHPKFLLTVVVILLTTPLWSSVGNVDIHQGNGEIERDTGDTFITELDLEIFMSDTVKTGNGKTSLLFLDDTRVDVTQHSKLFIDEFVYDPATQEGSIGIKAALGTVRYASGQIAKTSRQNITIKTPTATIGVRGTDFSMTVDELGGSTVILLPSCDSAGNCYVGEISVESDAGQVILNQAFQATMVDAVENRPLKPVQLSIDFDLISNLLIVSPPPEIDEAFQESYFKAVADALDVDFLHFDELDKDYLDVAEETWATLLDIDFLDQDLLPDILKQLNEELRKEMERDRLKDEQRQSTVISNVELGTDPETGISVVADGTDFIWTRSGATSTIFLRLDSENSYILNVKQGDFEAIDYELGEGQENAINIDQSD